MMPAGLAWHASRGRWRLPRHLELLNLKLLDVAAGRTIRLIVEMPPRHGKSEFISRYFPAWYLGKFPDKRVILSSYEGSFAASWGRKARDILEAFGPEVFGISVSRRSSAADAWDIAGREGGMNTAGAGGAITGKGAHLAIIDDPIKNQQESMSQARRDEVYDWYRATLRTRLEPGGAIILVMTRWHEDDLAGRLIAGNDDDDNEPWEILKLPAFAEDDDDPLGREAGEALWPQRYPVASLEALQRELGPYWFSALFQQRPVPKGGQLFKPEKFRYFSEDGEVYVLHGADDARPKLVLKRDCYVFTTVDLASTESTKADYTVAGTFALTPDNDLLVLEIARAQIEGPDQIPFLWGVYHRRKPATFRIEKTGYQATLIQGAKRDGLPIGEPLTPGTVDKWTRAIPAAARIEAGGTYFPEHASWLPDFEAELVRFPAGKNDDQVDVLSYAETEAVARNAQRVRAVRRPRRRADVSEAERATVREGKAGDPASRPGKRLSRQAQRRSEMQ